jgi:hypothetical protein
LVTALGISVGNTVLVRYLLIALMALLLFAYRRFSCLPCTSTRLTTYTNKEREGVLHLLAFSLLLSRDGFYDDQTAARDPIERDDKEGRGEGTRSLIRDLQHELSSQDNIQRFYPIGQEKPVPAREGQPPEDHPSNSLDLEKALIPLRSSEMSQLRPSASASSPPSPHASTVTDGAVEIVWNPLKPSLPSPPSE